MPSRLRFSIGIGLLALCLTSACAAQIRLPHRWTPLSPAPVSWTTVNQRLSKELLTADLGALAQQARTAPAPKTPEAWLRRLAILVRADYRQDALKTLTARPRFLSNRQDWKIGLLVSESGAYDSIPLAHRLCTLFPEQTTDYYWFGTWANQTPTKEVDRWLARQGERGEGRWARLRLKFRAEQGTEGELLKVYAERVRRRPAEIEPAEDFLAAVAATQKPQDISLIGKVCKPRLAVASYTLARMLTADPQGVIALGERALRTPFTPADAQWFLAWGKRMRFSYGFDRMWLTEAQLHQWTKGMLLEAYKKTNQIQKAQATLEELTKDRGMRGVLAYSAGEIQAQSGARVVESRIKETEKEEPESPRYWMERGEYYSGRKEDKEAVAAFEKALSLAPIPTKNEPSYRPNIISAYARHLWLKSVEMPTEAYALLRQELARVPLKSDYAWTLLMSMHYYDNDQRKLMQYDDPLIWEYLAQEQDWNRARQILQRLFQHAPDSERERLYERGDQLARGGGYARVSGWADLLLTRNRYQRALPWFLEAKKLAQDDYQRSNVRSGLWRCYQGLNDWRNMEALASEGQPGSLYFGQVFMEIAIAAAQAGATEEAFRLFRQWSNQDRRLAPSFYPLPSQGLMESLKTYYRALAEREPFCETPQRVKLKTGIG